MSKYNLSLRLFFSEKNSPETILSAVEPDIGKRHQRSETFLESNGEELLLKVSAEDPTALRASFNSAFKGIILSNELIQSYSRR